MMTHRTTVTPEQRALDFCLLLGISVEKVTNALIDRKDISLIYNGGRFFIHVNGEEKAVVGTYDTVPNYDDWDLVMRKLVQL